MTRTHIAAAIALALLPSLADARCTGDVHSNTSASACGESQVYDETTKSCVTKPTS
jgi:hypothetical protein